MKNVSDFNGLHQFLSRPTRGEYLLDLVLSNNADIKFKVEGKFSDHACVSVKIPDAMEVRTFAPRLVWKFADANWDAIETRLASIDWNCLLQDSVDDALDFFLDTLDSVMQAHVPHFMKNECRSNFPWVTDECRHAVSVKHAAEGTASYTEAAERCTAVLQRVRAAYLYRVKASMERLPPGSKKWWRQLCSPL